MVSGYRALCVQAQAGSMHHAIQASLAEEGERGR